MVLKELRVLRDRDAHNPPGPCELKRGTTSRRNNLPTSFPPLSFGRLRLDLYLHEGNSQLLLRHSAPSALLLFVAAIQLYRA